MRKSALIGMLSAAMCLVSCTHRAGSADDSIAIREMAIAMDEQYPMATLQDVYKTCYQDRFGAEHAVAATDAEAYLHYELAHMDGDSTTMPHYEACGYRHRHERVSLQTVRDGVISEEQLLQDFIQAATAPKEGDKIWAEEWGAIEQIAIEAVPKWADDTLQNNLRYAASLDVAVHHSPSFRDAYHPHYRIRINNNKTIQQ